MLVGFQAALYRPIVQTDIIRRFLYLIVIDQTDKIIYAIVQMSVNKAFHQSSNVFE